MEITFLISAFLIWMVLLLAAAFMARSNGRSFWLWFCLSIPFPFFTLFIIRGLPDKRKITSPALVYETDELGIYH